VSRLLLLIFDKVLVAEGQKVLMEDQDFSR
jgi:hypothetical protein